MIIFHEKCGISLFLEARDLLRKWRDDNERKSDDVVQLWKCVVVDKLNKFGNERLIVLEQSFIAGNLQFFSNFCHYISTFLLKKSYSSVSALDCGQIELAEDCISLLASEFPGSLRILKYKAMLLESLERYDDALDVLESIIKKDETNAAPRKRKIAILKAKGLIPEAIKEICDYLKK